MPVKARKAQPCPAKAAARMTRPYPSADVLRPAPSTTWIFSSGGCLPALSDSSYRDIPLKTMMANETRQSREISCSISGSETFLAPGPLKARNHPFADAREDKLRGCRRKILLLEAKLLNPPEPLLPSYRYSYMRPSPFPGRQKKNYPLERRTSAFAREATLAVGNPRYRRIVASLDVKYCKDRIPVVRLVKARVGLPETLACLYEPEDE